MGLREGGSALALRLQEDSGPGGLRGLVPDLVRLVQDAPARSHRFCALLPAPFPATKAVLVDSSSAALR